MIYYNGSLLMNHYYFLTRCLDTEGHTATRQAGTGGAEALPSSLARVPVSPNPRRRPPSPALFSRSIFGDLGETNLPDSTISSRIEPPWQLQTPERNE